MLMLENRLLDALAAVVEEGGFERAGKRLGLSQSAISQRIRLLEDRLGQVVLSRTVPPVATDAGRRLIRHWRQVRMLEAEVARELHLDEEEAESMAIGLNADSLATWFPDVAAEVLETESVRFDFRIDDQDVTHRMLRDGEVVGCVSSSGKPVQGCGLTFLGFMRYRLLGSPDYVARWFPDGLSLEGVSRAPILVFNRKDRLQDRLFEKRLGASPPHRAHFVPSVSEFFDFARRGLGCGMIPDLQSRDARKDGSLVEVDPEGCLSVPLYWHCWNIASKRLDRLTARIVGHGNRVLARS